MTWTNVHPEGMAENSPTFQRWELNSLRVKVPKDRSADFPVRSNPGTLYGSEKTLHATSYTLLRTGKSALRY